MSELTSAEAPTSQKPLTVLPRDLLGGRNIIGRDNFPQPVSEVPKVAKTLGSWSIEGGIAMPTNTAEPSRQTSASPYIIKGRRE